MPGIVVQGGGGNEQQQPHQPEPKHEAQAVECGAGPGNVGQAPQRGNGGDDEQQGGPEEHDVSPRVTLACIASATSMVQTYVLPGIFLIGSSPKGASWRCLQTCRTK